MPGAAEPELDDVLETVCGSVAALIAGDSQAAEVLLRRSARSDATFGVVAAVAAVGLLAGAFMQWAAEKGEGPAGARVLWSAFCDAAMSSPDT